MELNLHFTTNPKDWRPEEWKGATEEGFSQNDDLDKKGQRSNTTNAAQSLSSSLITNLQWMSTKTAQTLQQIRFTLLSSDFCTQCNGSILGFYFSIHAG